jgi:hypothetical protein
MDDPRTYRIYLRYMLAAAVCLFLLPFAASELLKIHFGELEPSEVVRRQLQSKDLLYLSGLNQDVAAYKLELAKAEMPDVIAVGSSRALQVRDFFFTAPFTNWGLAARTIGQLEWATREIARLPKKPKLVVVFLDSWWFNEKHRTGKDIYVLQQSHLGNIYRNTYVLTKSLFAGKRATGGKRLGLAAIRSNQGFDYYGSFHYTGRITGREKADIRFDNTLRRIDIQDDRWVGADDPNPFAIQRWQAARTELERAGVQVVEILPPFSSVVVDRLRSGGKHGYIWKLADQFGGRVLDYTDPRRIGDTSDCEFLDGFHGGEVTYAKVLLDAAKERPDLRPFVNIERLQGWVDANRGLASPTTIRLYGNGAREIDFLRIGCEKEARK